jgi:hypothetical protein
VISPRGGGGEKGSQERKTGGGGGQQERERQREREREHRTELTKNHHHAGLSAGLARDTSELVVLQARIQDSIGHLIADLVGVPLVHGLGGEEELACLGHGCGRVGGLCCVAGRWELILASYFRCRFAGEGLVWVDTPARHYHGQPPATAQKEKTGSIAKRPASPPASQPASQPAQPAASLVVLVHPCFSTELNFIRAYLQLAPACMSRAATSLHFSRGRQFHQRY